MGNERRQQLSLCFRYFLHVCARVYLSEAYHGYGDAKCAFPTLRAELNGTLFFLLLGNTFFFRQFVSNPCETETFINVLS